MYRLIPAILVIMAAFIVPAPAGAGEVEADVINGSYQSADLFTPDGLSFNQAGVDAFMLDITDIWLDTATDSHCEAYAGAVYGIAFLVHAISFDMSSNGGPTVTLPLPDVITIIEDQLPTLHRNCLNEA